MHGQELERVPLKQSQVPIEFRNILLQLNVLCYEALLQTEIFKSFPELSVGQPEQNFALFDVTYVANLLGSWELKFELRELKEPAENDLRNHFLAALEVADPEDQSLEIVPGKMHLELGPQLPLLAELVRKNGDACEKTVLALSEEAILDEVLREIDAIDAPVLDLVLPESQLTLHGVCTELDGELVLAELGVNLSQVKEGQGVIPL